MGIIERTFGVRCAVLPVIHIDTPEQAAEESLVAFMTGADGVFLIHHGGDTWLTNAAVLAADETLRVECQDHPWIGVNLLGVSPSVAFRKLHEYRAYEVRGVWCDEASAHPDAPPIKTDSSRGVWESTFFASVAFKHQPTPVDIATAAWREVAMGADVLTTSGPGTGMPCDPAKVRAIREAVGHEYGVAVASGVRPENVRGLVDAGADALLVATGIARGGDFYRMDPAKLRALIANVREASQ